MATTPSNCWRPLLPIAGEYNAAQGLYACLAMSTPSTRRYAATAPRGPPIPAVEQISSNVDTQLDTANEIIVKLVKMLHLPLSEDCELRWNSLSSAKKNDSLRVACNGPCISSADLQGLCC